MKPSSSRTCAGCGKSLYSDNISGRCKDCLYGQPVASSTPVDPNEQVVHDRERNKQQSAFNDLQAKYKAALDTIERQNTELDWVRQIREGVPSTFEVRPAESTGTSEAIPVIVASDWHSEEIVTAAQTSGLNTHNLEINQRRVERFFSASLNLIKNHLNPGVHIHTVVLALLGDFITGQIHEAENAENNALMPVPAILRVQDMMEKGINFYLNNSPYTFIIPCKVGNHSRNTRRVRSASEAAHSYETLLYTYLAAVFRNEPRVQFVMDDGYHTYLKLYDKTVRFHHGHALLYQGGIGGLFIPAYKAISQWDKAIRADLDVFGHFHQTKDGGKFLCNGSGIGYNAFAMRIKADYEPPQQTLFMIDKKRGRTCTWPILLEK